MTIDTIFIDLDNTLLDFYATEDHILGEALSRHGITPTPEVVARYQDINVAQWCLKLMRLGYAVLPCWWRRWGTVPMRKPFLIPTSI